MDTYADPARSNVEMRLPEQLFGKNLFFYLREKGRFPSFNFSAEKKTKQSVTASDR